MATAISFTSESSDKYLFLKENVEGLDLATLKVILRDFSIEPWYLMHVDCVESSEFSRGDILQVVSEIQIESQGEEQYG